MSVDPDCPSVDEVKSKKVILLWLLMHILMYMYMYSVYVYVCMLLISCGQCVWYVMMIIYTMYHV